MSFKKESSVVFESSEKELNAYDTVTCVTVHCRLSVSSLYTVHSLGLVERHAIEGEVGLAGQDAGGRGARCRVADLCLHGDLI